MRGRRAEPPEGGWPIGRSLDSYLQFQGFDQARNFGAIVRVWPEVVGEHVATHATPRLLRDDELVVAVDQSTWATELTFLSASILEGLETRLGSHVASRIKVLVRGSEGLQ